MKIQDRSVSPVEALQRAEQKPAVERALGTRVSGAGSSVKLSAAAVALSDDSSDVARTKQVSELKAAFERGDSIVNADRIADAMMQDAEESP